MPVRGPSGESGGDEIAVHATIDDSFAAGFNSVVGQLMAKNEQARRQDGDDTERKSDRAEPSSRLR